MRLVKAPTKFHSLNPCKTPQNKAYEGIQKSMGKCGDCTFTGNGFNPCQKHGKALEHHVKGGF